MKVEQIAELLKNVTKEIIGDSAIVTDDLSNVVQIGEAILSATEYDNYVRTLVNHIGKVDFHIRKYVGSVPDVYRDSWEYGSIRERVMFEMPDPEDNPSWNLQDGQVYEQDKFHKPNVSVTFFNGRTTYQIPLSITERQVKESFSNVNQLNGFISGLQLAIENAIQIKNDQLVMDTINSFIGLTLDNDKTGVKAVNLLDGYNTKFTKTLKAADAITDPDFIRYASYVMGLYSDRITRISKLFNIAGKAEFTPKEYLHFVMLSEFAKAADTYLQSDVFHNEFTSLPKAFTVPYWQGSGTDYSFDSTSAIDVTIKDLSQGGESTKTVQKSGILSVMFDHWALGVTNEDRRTTSHQNAVGEFVNYWYKVDAEYFNDTAHNFVVFYVADAE